MSFESSRIPVADNEADRQWLFIVRHGDRWDYEDPEWSESSSRPGDPPLSTTGHRQAFETGIFLDNVLADRHITDITWLSSPFLRTLQTSDEMLNAFQRVDTHGLPVLPEYSVFEWDGRGDGSWHASLPPLAERAHYFPRLDVTHPSLFVPEIPEPRSQFHARCQRAVDALNRRYVYQAATAIVIVSHAAGCVGLTRAAMNNGTFADVTPASPCSVFGLWRTSNAPSWALDAHDAPHSLNGHTQHLSDLASDTTVPWNHFGDKAVFKGYTGPPTSRFAPSGFAEYVAEQEEKKGDEL